MNKIYMKLFAVLSAAAILYSCSDDGNDSGSISDVPNTTESGQAADSGDGDSQVSGYSAEDETETAAEPENHELQRNIQPAEGTYVYDYAEILSSGDFSECNDYAEWLYENYLINVAVVTTDDIEGLTPEQYAEDAYIRIYSGRGSGLLLLINNDTNEDYLYKTGSCLTYINSEEEKDEFYWATQEIIGGNYKDAVMRILQLGESCPQHVFDNGGIFTSEQLASLDQLCDGGESDISVLATSNTTGSANEEICRSYYERRYQDVSGFMIMLDTETRSVILMKDSQLVEELGSGVLANANTLAASGDYVGAVSAIINELKG